MAIILTALISASTGFTAGLILGAMLASSKLEPILTTGESEEDRA
jgi:hypothetical protein